MADGLVLRMQEMMGYQRRKNCSQMPANLIATPPFQEISMSIPSYDEVKLINQWINATSNPKNSKFEYFTMLRHTLLFILSSHWERTDCKKDMLFAVKNHYNKYTSITPNYFYVYRAVLRIAEKKWDNGYFNFEDLYEGKKSINNKEVQDYFAYEPEDVVLARVHSLVIEEKFLQACKLSKASLMYHTRITKTLGNSSSSKVHEGQHLKIVYKGGRSSIDWFVSLLKKKIHLNDIVEEVKDLYCHEGVEIVCRAKRDPKNKRFSFTLLQIFLLQDLIKPLNFCCTKKLFVLFCVLHKEMNSSIREIISSSQNILTHQAPSSAHFYLFCDVLWSYFGSKCVSLCVEFFVRGLTADLNHLEVKKVSGASSDVKYLETHVATMFEKLSSLFIDSHKSVARECLFSAFCVRPNKKRLFLLERLTGTLSAKSEDGFNGFGMSAQNCECGLKCGGPCRTTLGREVFAHPLLSKGVENMSVAILNDLVSVLESVRSITFQYNVFDWKTSAHVQLDCYLQTFCEKNDSINVEMIGENHSENPRPSAPEASVAESAVACGPVPQKVSIKRKNTPEIQANDRPLDVAAVVEVRNTADVNKRAKVSEWQTSTSGVFKPTASSYLENVIKMHLNEGTSQTSVNTNFRRSETIPAVLSFTQSFSENKNSFKAINMNRSAIASHSSSGASRQSVVIAPEKNFTQAAQYPQHRASPLFHSMQNSASSISDMSVSSSMQKSASSISDTSVSSSMQKSVSSTTNAPSCSSLQMPVSNISNLPMSSSLQKSASSLVNLPLSSSMKKSTPVCSREIHSNSPGIMESALNLSDARNTAKHGFALSPFVSSRPPSSPIPQVPFTKHQERASISPNLTKFNADRTSVIQHTMQHRHREDVDKPTNQPLFCSAEAQKTQMLQRNNSLSVCQTNVSSANLTVNDSLLLPFRSKAFSSQLQGLSVYSSNDRENVSVPKSYPSSAVVKTASWNLSTDQNVFSPSKSFRPLVSSHQERKPHHHSPLDKVTVQSPSHPQWAPNMQSMESNRKKQWSASSNAYSQSSSGFVQNSNDVGSDSSFYSQRLKTPTSAMSFSMGSKTVERPAHSSSYSPSHPPPGIYARHTLNFPSNTVLKRTPTDSKLSVLLQSPTNSSIYRQSIHFPEQNIHLSSQSAADSSRKSVGGLPGTHSHFNSSLPGSQRPYDRLSSQAQEPLIQVSCDFPLDPLKENQEEQTGDPDPLVLCRFCAFSYPTSIISTHIKDEHPNEYRKRAKSNVGSKTLSKDDQNYTCAINVFECDSFVDSNNESMFDGSTVAKENLQLQDFDFVNSFCDALTQSTGNLIKSPDGVNDLPPDLFKEQTFSELLNDVPLPPNFGDEFANAPHVDPSLSNSIKDPQGFHMKNHNLINSASSLSLANFQKTSGENGTSEMGFAGNQDGNEMNNGDDLLDLESDLNFWQSKSDQISGIDAMFGIPEYDNQNSLICDLKAPRNMAANPTSTGGGSTCYFCRNVFDSDADLLVHIRACHPDSMDETAEALNSSSEKNVAPLPGMSASAAGSFSGVYSVNPLKGCNALGNEKCVFDFELHGSDERNNATYQPVLKKIKVTSKLAEKKFLEMRENGPVPPGMILEEEKKNCKPMKPCPHCGKHLTVAYLKEHVSRVHGAKLDKNLESNLHSSPSVVDSRESGTESFRMNDKSPVEAEFSFSVGGEGNSSLSPNTPSCPQQTKARRCPACHQVFSSRWFYVKHKKNCVGKTDDGRSTSESSNNSPGKMVVKPGADLPHSSCQQSGNNSLLCLSQNSEENGFEARSLVDGRLSLSSEFPFNEQSGGACLAAPKSVKKIPKVYNCTLCSKSFSYQKNLTTHMETHNQSAAPVVNETVLKKEMSSEDAKLYESAYTYGNSFMNREQPNHSMDREASDFFKEDLDFLGPPDKHYREIGDLASEDFTATRRCASAKLSLQEDASRATEFEASQNVVKDEDPSSPVKSKSNSSEVKRKSSVKQFECKICNAVLSSKSAYTLHIKSLHENTSNEILRCPVCPKLLTSMKRYQNHLNTKHFRNQKCCVCSKELNSLDEFEAHVKTHPPKTPRKSKVNVDKKNVAPGKVKHEKSSSETNEPVESSANPDGILTSTPKSLLHNTSHISENSAILTDSTLSDSKSVFEKSFTESEVKTVLNNSNRSVIPTHSFISDGFGNKSENSSMQFTADQCSSMQTKRSKSNSPNRESDPIPDSSTETCLSFQENSFSLGTNSVVMQLLQDFEKLSDGIEDSKEKCDDSDNVFVRENSIIPNEGPYDDFNSVPALTSIHDHFRYANQHEFDLTERHHSSEDYNTGKENSSATEMTESLKTSDSVNPEMCVHDLQTQMTEIISSDNKSNASKICGSTNSSPLNCPACLKVIYDRDELKKHVQILHPEMSAKLFICSPDYIAQGSQSAFANDSLTQDAKIAWNSSPHMRETLNDFENNVTLTNPTSFDSSIAEMDEISMPKLNLAPSLRSYSRVQRGEIRKKSVTEGSTIETNGVFKDTGESTLLSNNLAEETTEVTNSLLNCNMESQLDPAEGNNVDKTVENNTPLRKHSSPSLNLPVKKEACDPNSNCDSELGNCLAPLNNPVESIPTLINIAAASNSSTLEDMDEVGMPDLCGFDAQPNEYPRQRKLSIDSNVSSISDDGFLDILNICKNYPEDILDSTSLDAIERPSSIKDPMPLPQSSDASSEICEKSPPASNIPSNLNSCDSRKYCSKSVCDSTSADEDISCRESQSIDSPSKICDKPSLQSDPAPSCSKHEENMTCPVTDQPDSPKFSQNVYDETDNLNVGGSFRCSDTASEIMPGVSTEIIRDVSLLINDCKDAVCAMETYAQPKHLNESKPECGERLTQHPITIKLKAVSVDQRSSPVGNPSGFIHPVKQEPPSSDDCDGTLPKSKAPVKKCRRCPLEFTSPKSLTRHRRTHNKFPIRQQNENPKVIRPRLRSGNLRKAPFLDLALESNCHSDSSDIEIIACIPAPPSAGGDHGRAKKRKVLRRSEYCGKSSLHRSKKARKRHSVHIEEDSFIVTLKAEPMSPESALPKCVIKRNTHKQYSVFFKSDKSQSPKHSVFKRKHCGVRSRARLHLSPGSTMLRRTIPSSVKARHKLFSPKATKRTTHPPVNEAFTADERRVFTAADIERFLQSHKQPVVYLDRMEIPVCLNSINISPVVKLERLKRSEDSKRVEGFPAHDRNHNELVDVVRSELSTRPSEKEPMSTELSIVIQKLPSAEGGGKVGAAAAQENLSSPSESNEKDESGPLPKTTELSIVIKKLPSKFECGDVKDEPAIVSHSATHSQESRNFKECFVLLEKLPVEN